MKNQLRAGIIGSGFMAKVHTRAIRDSGNIVAAKKGLLQCDGQFVIFFQPFRILLHVYVAGDG